MTIPAKRIVTVNPGVISANGNALSLNCLFLTENILMPAGRVIAFASAAAVSAFFGPNSTEAARAATYFAGYNNSTSKPSQMLFVFYAATAQAASLTSGSFAGITLSELQAIDGVLTITVDGVVKTSATIDLSGATSFTNAATLITAGFSGGSAPTITWDALNSTFVVTSPTTGVASTIGFATGSISDDLLFTADAGAFISVGTDADTPGEAMDKFVGFTQNFVSFYTIFEPDLAHKEAFAAWSAEQNSRFMYLGWDTDTQAIVADASATFGAVMKAGAVDGVICLSGNTTLPGADMAALGAFVAGAIASIDFTRRNGRITFAFRSGPISATVDDDTEAQNLLGNGYSFYGSYATANAGFVFLYNAALPGRWKWLDSFINQVWFNSQLQLAFMNLITAVGSIDYAADGYGLMRAAAQDPINAALNFGAIRTGVTLSAAEIAEVNAAAGQDISNILQTQGYYQQILDPGADVRNERGSPVYNIWYTDGGAVQQITINSTDIL